MSRLGTSHVQNLIRDALDHHRAGRFAEAEHIYRQILTISPRHSDSLHLLGMVAFQTGRSEESVALIQRAIGIKANAASYHSNLGNVLQSQGKLDQAGTCYQRALLLKPDSAEVCVNLGNVFRAQGHLDSSLSCYRRASGLKPEFAEAATAEAAVLLLKGDFAAGWIGSERRWDTFDNDTPKRTYAWPRWRGETLSSGQLLFWGEQGIGDEIMFAGLIPDVVRSGNSCVLDCDPRLKRLFARSFPYTIVVSGLTPDSHLELDIAAHLPCGSLPSLLRTSCADFGATTSPYLLADRLKQTQFRARYSDGRKIVGLAWYTKNGKTGRSRSIDLSLLAPLFGLSGIRWISLQYGDHGSLERQAAVANSPILIDREVDQFSNMDVFAAQIAAMDLVITIDNSTAHLAAALGVPTWVLLPFAPDWRWLLDRNDSPWYPSIRLFRQTKIGEWQSVVQRVGSALSQCVVLT
ncbi:MAG: tetratricopeptide repeat protein [Terracidiphilus sp.]